LFLPRNVVTEMSSHGNGPDRNSQTESATPKMAYPERKELHPYFFLSNCFIVFLFLTMAYE